MSRLDEILLLVKRVPPFPKVAQRVMAMLGEPDIEAADLAEVIKYDAAITANVLKICNAAYFGLTRKVSSLDEALVVIGNDALKEIIVTSSSAKFYKGNVGAGYELAQGELWRHSVAAAIMAKTIVNLPKQKIKVEGGAAFTSALLHDIGKRFLSSFVADDFANIIKKVDKEKCSFVEAEKELLGASHAEIGGMILESWEFSKEMIDAVKQHHDEDVLDKEPLSALVALSNTMIISMGIGGGADGLATRIQGKALGRFGISGKDLDVCMATLLTELERAEELLNL